MRKRLLLSIGILSCGVSFGIAGQLGAFDLFGDSLFRTRTCDACGSIDIFRCWPEVAARGVIARASEGQHRIRQYRRETRRCGKDPAV